MTVDVILNDLGEGVAVDGLLAAYPRPGRKDVPDAMRLGAWSAQERGVLFGPPVLRVLCDTDHQPSSRATVTLANDGVRLRPFLHTIGC